MVRDKDLVALLAVTTLVRSVLCSDFGLLNVCKKNLMTILLYIKYIQAHLNYLYALSQKTSQTKCANASPIAPSTYEWTSRLLVKQKIKETAAEVR